MEAETFIAMVFPRGVLEKMTFEEVEAGIKEYRENGEWHERVYHSELESIRHYLIKIGNGILPKHYGEFLMWWCGPHKYGHLSLAEAVKIAPTDKDFLEYQKWRERQLKPGVPTSTADELSSIFKDPEYYRRCLKILDHYDAPNLTTRKGYILFAIIDRIKHHSRKLLKKETATDEYLLSIFNAHLGKNYIEVNRDSKGFRDTVAEVETMLSDL
jgi:hypothetical protein